MKRMILTAILLFASLAHAQDLGDDLNALGGNEALMERAQALSPHNRVTIVQNRAVDRSLRLELGLNMTQASGGDPYLDTIQKGVMVDFHFSPRFSAGVRYNEYENALSNEGQRRYDEAEQRSKQGLEWLIPEIDSPLNETMGVISFYPIYGKLNLFDLTVAQFDIYTLAGYGQMQLASGPTDTWTAGLGTGIWLSQHFSTRLEARYQSYEDQVRTGSRDQNMTIVTATIGFLL